MPARTLVGLLAVRLHGSQKIYERLTASHYVPNSAPEAPLISSPLNTSCSLGMQSNAKITRNPRISDFTSVCIPKLQKHKQPRLQFSAMLHCLPVPGQRHTGVNCLPKIATKQEVKSRTLSRCIIKI